MRTTHSLHGILLAACLSLAASCTGVDHEPHAKRILRFAVIGDTQGQQILPALVRDLNANDAEYLIVPGDLVSTGGTSPGENPAKPAFGSWQSWIQQAASFGPGLDHILMAPGNHDLPSGSDERWRTVFAKTPDGKPWLPNSPTINGKRGLDQMDYFVDVGNVRFVSVTTDTLQYGAQRLGKESLAWLLAALRETEAVDSIEHVFVYTHHPVTFDSATERLGSTAGELWSGIMAASTKTRALFTGHWHLFQPSRPDPLRPETWEVVAGTGGGGLEGRLEQSHHGFLLVDVFADGTVDANFFSDHDAASNGWQFDDVLDSFTLHAPNALSRSPLVASYDFEHGDFLVDSTRTDTKRVHGELHGDAHSCDGVYGRALSLDGQGHAAAAAVGDYELAILADLTIEVCVRLRSASNAPATLVEYSAAGPHPDAECEAVNTCYSLQLDAEGHLVLAWEFAHGIDHTVRSSAPANLPANTWTRVRCTRGHEQREVRFYVGDLPLGQAVTYSQPPTGGGGGFLHIGRSANGTNGFVGDLDELRICRLAMHSQRFAPTLIRGDLDGNGALQPSDLSIFSARFAPDQPELDLDGDGTADEQDLAILVRAIETKAEQHATLNAPSFGIDAADSDVMLTLLGGVTGKQTYSFESNRGLRLDGLTAARRSHYKLNCLVAFSSFGNGKWGKLVDFAKRQTDTGLYLREHEGKAVLEFFPNLGKGTTEIQLGTFHHIELRRDANTKLVEVYLDGAREFQFVDAKDEAVFAAAHLFCDDRGAESAAGSLHRLRVAAPDATRPVWPGNLRLPRMTIDADGTVRIDNQMPNELALEMITVISGPFEPAEELAKNGWCAIRITNDRVAFVHEDAGVMSIPPMSARPLGVVTPLRTTGPNPVHVAIVPQGSSLRHRHELPVVPVSRQ